jgi:hypothetical protein
MHPDSILSSMSFTGMPLHSFDTYRDDLVVLFIRSEHSKEFVLLCLSDS